MLLTNAKSYGNIDNALSNGAFGVHSWRGVRVV